MKVSMLARVMLGAAILMFSTGTVLAAREKEQKDDYPNATRKERSVEMSSREQRDLGKATDLVNDGKNEEALPLVQKILANEKIKPYAAAFAEQLLGRIYWDTEKDLEAVEETSKAIALDALPNNAHFALMYQLAQMQVQAEKYDDALVTLDRFEKETGKTDAEQWALRGNIYYRLDRFQDAIDTMKKALAASNEPKENWNQILMASLFELDQYDEAATIVKAQLAKHPADLKLIKQLATIYINGDKYPQAIEVQTRRCRKHPQGRHRQGRAPGKPGSKPAFGRCLHPGRGRCVCDRRVYKSLCIGHRWQCRLSTRLHAVLFGPGSRSKSRPAARHPERGPEAGRRGICTSR